MVDVKVDFILKNFNGDSFDAICSIENNLFTNIDILKRNLPSFFEIKISVSQTSSNIFSSTLHVSYHDKTISEDVIIGQVESNIESVRKMGLLSIELHNWELETRFP